MKRLLIGFIAVATAGAALTTSAAPYEDYRLQIQRVQEAKQNSHGPAAGMHGQRQSLMQEMTRQLQEARSVDQMYPEEMRSWITRHTQLMDQVHEQMTAAGGMKPPVQ